MTLKEIARTFNITIERLASLTGYSRQYLYLLQKSNFNKQGDAIKKIVSALEKQSNAIFEVEKKQIYSRKIDRENTIYFLKKKAAQSGPTDQAVRVEKTI